MTSARVQFSQSSTNVYRGLRESGELLDVTLVCDDQSTFTAHKLVLSAHSDLLRRYLVAAPGQASLFMFNVNSRDLANILDFLYLGQVEISQSEVARFISLAKKLGVNDLVAGEKESLKLSRDISSLLSSREREAPRPSREREAQRLSREREAQRLSREREAQRLSREREAQRLSREREAPRQSREREAPGPSLERSGRHICQYCGKCFISRELLASHRLSHLAENSKTKVRFIETEASLSESAEVGESGADSKIAKVELQQRDFQEFSTLQGYLDTMITSAGGGFQCNVCDKKTLVRSEAEEHASLHIEGLSYPCKHCQKIFSSSSQLRSHQMTCSGQKVEQQVSWGGEVLHAPGSRGAKVTSDVWRFGGFRRKEDGQLDMDRIICGLCGKHLKYSGSPSSYRIHLLSKHSSVYLSALGKSGAGNTTEDSEATENSEVSEELEDDEVNTEDPLVEMITSDL